MLKSPSSRFDPLEIGSTVRVSIPDVDRARGAPRNLLAVVLDVENDLYKLGKLCNSKCHGSLPCENK
ncbi:unnamed protein product [Macrosiphum euphorbiae]|uniref:Primosomal protein N' 3' DNA-binding domain-containing protein n=1 Tax=Macrosiphum euphorbiae TaxID=13131 RepID=A0AAV0YA17_9HEMI|nr:unnamed protein product [Macrosiphum euphorbiae]